MKALIRPLRWLVVAILVFWLGGLLLYRFVDPPATPLMLIRSLQRGAWVAYHPVDFAAVAPALGRAVVASERSEEHTSELQSLMRISYAVFCLKKKKYTQRYINEIQLPYTHTL